MAFLDEISCEKTYSNLWNGLSRNFFAPIAKMNTVQILYLLLLCDIKGDGNGTRSVSMRGLMMGMVESRPPELVKVQKMMMMQQHLVTVAKV